MYKTIIFDLDDTLNDDTKNMQEAFKILTKDKYSDEEFKKFQTIDKNYWKERAAGIVKDPREGMSREEKAEWNRAQRFLRYFKGISYEEAVKMNEIYTEGLKRKVQEIEGAKEIIKYLKDKKYDEALKLGSACGGATAFSEDLAEASMIQEVYKQLQVEEL